MIRVISKGDFSKTKNFFTKILHGDAFAELDRYGQLGVEALSRATPVDTGLTQDSWTYKIKRKPPSIEWHNINTVNGTSVAILIQYGHGTGTGGYVIGRDFINPAMQPIFDKIADDIWKKVIT